MTSTPSADVRAVAPAWWWAAGPARTAVRRVVLVVVAGGLFGWLGVATQPDEHVARAVLVIATVDDEDSAARATATQLALLTSDAVLGPVAERARTPREELARTVEAHADPAESLLRVDVAAATAGRARAIVADIVTEYLTVAHSGDVPADGLVRVRLVLPPYPVVDAAPTASGGAAIGAAIGLGVALATAAVTRRPGRAVR